MHSLSLHENSPRAAAPDLKQEVAQLEALLAERRADLARLQEEFRAFKTRYTHVVGSRLAELAEVEREVREAEARLAGLEHEAEDEDDASAEPQDEAPAPRPTSLRKLFWSVARMFHPDHAKDAGEAQRRHSIMAEASRAYRDGDLDSLSTLLGDEQLQSYCATSQGADEPEDLAGRLIRLKDELRTVEFGLKRIRQDGLYRLHVSAAEQKSSGRDVLAEMAESIGRQIIKARHRLENLSI